MFAHKFGAASFKPICLSPYGKNPIFPYIYCHSIFKYNFFILQDGQDFFYTIELEDLDSKNSIQTLPIENGIAASNDDFVQDCNNQGEEREQIVTSGPSVKKLLTYVISSSLGGLSVLV
jgi:hypothetical protein